MAESIRTEKTWLKTAKRWVLFLALFALPWIDVTNISTLLLCGLGVLVIADRPGTVSLKKILADKVLWLFFLYYLAFVVAWIVFPADPLVRFALEQKAAFAVMPLLLAVLLNKDKTLWPQARWAFLSGVTFALVCCLVNAFIRYLQLHDSGVFFYHDLVSLLSANAIYISVDVLIAIAYTISFLGKEQEVSPVRKAALNGLLIFLLLTLFLLSSKTLIVTGVILFLYCIYRYAGSHLQKAGFILLVIALLAAVFIFPNKIQERYSTVAWKQPDIALKYKDYSTTTFDGLNLRMLLWRLSGELLTDHNAWLTGLGGKHYHQALNEKIVAYKMNEGYLNYDFHNQYIETLAGFGLGGLFWILFTLTYIVSQSVRRHHTMPTILTLIFSVSFLTESFLETQAGILVFTIIISGEWIQRPYS